MKGASMARGTCAPRLLTAELVCTSEPNVSMGPGCAVGGVSVLSTVGAVGDWDDVTETDPEGPGGKRVKKWEA